MVYTRDDAGRLLRRRSLATLTPTPSENLHSLFYLHDGLGSVCQLIDWDGKTHLRSDYDAWGTAESSGMRADDEPFRYRAGYQDPDTHLLNFGARWYAPGWGRWLSRDPLLINLISQGRDVLPRFRELTNLYAYVFNDPLNMTDFTGRGPLLDLLVPPSLQRIGQAIGRGGRILVLLGKLWNQEQGPPPPPPGPTEVEESEQKMPPASQSTGDPAARTSDPYHPPDQPEEGFNRQNEGFNVTLGALVGLAIFIAPEVTLPALAFGAAFAQ